MIRVYCDVVGDLFHTGHLNLFRQAREHGSFLIVGVHSDKSVESYKRKPIYSENERYSLISNCKLVDQIIEDAPLTISKEFILDNNIDVVVHGNDKNPQFKIQHKVPLDMGIMRYVEYTKGISTSEIIDRIKKS